MSIKSLAAAAALTLAAAPASAEVILINVFEVPAGKVETVIAAWEEARDFLSARPGYISTRLHRSLRPDARFELVNVARWETAEAFAAATGAMAAEGIFPTIDGLGVNPALYRVIREDRPSKE